MTAEQNNRIIESLEPGQTENRKKKNQRNRIQIRVMNAMNRVKPIVQTQMLIRRPVAEVFEAFVDPAITTQFWFTNSSGRLEAGKEVCWDWDMYGVSAKVTVKEIEQNKRILIEWGDPPSPVEWIFDARVDQETLVRISTWGFHGSNDELVAQSLDSKGGFTIVLAGLKALLEHDVTLNLVADQFPKGYSQ